MHDGSQGQLERVAEWTSLDDITASEESLSADERPGLLDLSTCAGIAEFKSSGMRKKRTEKRTRMIEIVQEEYLR